MIEEKRMTNVQIRKATLHDKDDIETVMKRSMELLGQGHYNSEQVQSSMQYVCVPDEQIIIDGTYYVVEDEYGVMLACGGWSFRNKLYSGPAIKADADDSIDPKHDKARIRAMFVLPNISSRGLGTLILNTSEMAAKAYGFRRAALGATQSGVAFYKAKGWAALNEDVVMLPDGVEIKITVMEKEL